MYLVTGYTKFFWRVDKIWPLPGPGVWIKRWLTCLKIYFGISTRESALPCCTCWNMFQGPRKRMMRQCAGNHFYWSMPQTTLRHKKWATRQCATSQAWYILYLISIGPKKYWMRSCAQNHFYCSMSLTIWRPWKCVKGLLKMKQRPWNMLLITLKTRGCVKGLLNMNQTP